VRGPISCWTSFHIPIPVVDLHIGNLGCTLPGLSERSVRDVLEHFSEPECTVVLPINPGKQTASLPPYLVTAMSMADYMVNADPPLPGIGVPSLKILDFGSGTSMLMIFSAEITWVLQHI
jgi:hypothetical protein